MRICLSQEQEFVSLPEKNDVVGEYWTLTIEQGDAK